MQDFVCLLIGDADPSACETVDRIVGGFAQHVVRSGKVERTFVAPLNIGRNDSSKMSLFEDRVHDVETLKRNVLVHERDCGSVEGLGDV